MTIHRAERYGGSFRRRGSRRNAKIVGASMVVSIYSVHGSFVYFSSTYISMPFGSIAIEHPGLIIQGSKDRYVCNHPLRVFSLFMLGTTQFIHTHVY